MDDQQAARMLVDAYQKITAEMSKFIVGQKRAKKAERQFLQRG